MSSSRNTWPSGVDRVVLAEVDSTNAEARRRADQILGPTWILGLRQTQGKGRRGRAWTDPEGNFAATLAIRPDGSPLDWAQRSVVAALALRDTLEELAGPNIDLSLKWPNDVLLNGSKVAGILLESDATGLLCVGIGVNLVAAPDAAQLEPAALKPVSVLEETGVKLGAEQVLDLLASRFADWDSRLSSFGFGPLRNAFLQKAAKRGEQITVRASQQSWQGRFVDIDEHGAIVLETDNERLSIPAGDVFF